MQNQTFLALVDEKLFSKEILSTYCFLILVANFISHLYHNIESIKMLSEQRFFFLLNVFGGTGIRSLSKYRPQILFINYE